MKKTVVLIFLILSLAIMSGCAVIGNALGGGANADVTLSYTKYPPFSLGVVKNIAVIPFEESSMYNGEFSLWGFIERKYNAGSLSLLMADDLSRKLAEKQMFKLYDRNIAKNDSSIEMVIAGLITVQDITNNVEQVTTVDKQGYNHYSYNAVCNGLLSVNYRFVDPKSGEILNTSSIQRHFSTTAQDQTRGGALSKLPNKTQVLHTLLDQANDEFISTFMPVEISASYALATIKGDDIFKKSLVFAKSNDWEAAVDIWNRYEEQNSKEACYNKLLYKRYIEKNLDEAISYASTSYQKSGDPAFAKWLSKFEREREYETRFNNPLNQSSSPSESGASGGSGGIGNYEPKNRSW